MKIRITLDHINKDSIVNKVIGKYHYDMEARERIDAVYDKLLICITPYAIYKLNQKTTGVKALDEGQSALVAMTLGEGVDRLMDRLERDNLLEEAYMLDCLTAEILLEMYAEFNKMYAKFHRRYVERYVFIGDEIPTEKIAVLLDDLMGREKKSTDNLENDEQYKLEDAKILASTDGIFANEYGVLKPAKSVIFYALLSDNSKTVCEGICLSCGNSNCPNRIDSKQNDTVKSIRNSSGDKIASEANENIKLSYGFQRIFGNVKP